MIYDMEFTWLKALILACYVVIKYPGQLSMYNNSFTFDKRGIVLSEVRE